MEREGEACPRPQQREGEVRKGPKGRERVGKEGEEGSIGTEAIHLVSGREKE